jgi:hypothetical protein
MPLFFNAESHAWIAYLFFANGVLLSLLLRSVLKPFERLTKQFESIVVFAFIISITINGALLFVLDQLNLEFHRAIWGLLALSIFLIIFFARLFIQDKQFLVRITEFDWSVTRVVFYALVFIMLFYNGGMIDQLSDAWWHMSLTNKIALANSFNPDLGHLTGAPARYYPPLWHGNLALAHLVSGDSIPVIWNSFTAWGAMIKVMAFYCFAYGLTQNNKMALMAAVLFVLLPGVGNSYLRVSAWPSHVAYTVWYFMLFVFFTTVNGLVFDDRATKHSIIKESISGIKEYWLNILIMLLLAGVIFVAHQTELLWFAVACFAYLASASIYRAVSSDNIYIAYRDHGGLRLMYRLILLVMLVIAACYAYENFQTANIDQMLTNILPLLALFALLLVELSVISSQVKIVGLITISIVVCASINITHLLSLFFPEMAVPRGMFVESPSSVQGYFGGALDLPGWHLQLRVGLLFSGVLAVPLSIVLLVIKPNVTSLFVCGTAVLAFIFCLSPYLYHWLKDILYYHSPWRIAILIFHPIVFSMCIIELLNWLRGEGRKVEAEN